MFSSVQDGIYALGKTHTCCTLSLRRFPNTVNGSNVHLIDDGPLSSFQGRSSSNFSFLQVIDSVMSLALCPQVVLEASQHFRSSEKNKENDIRWNIVFHHNQGCTGGGVCLCVCVGVYRGSAPLPFFSLPSLSPVLK